MAEVTIPLPLDHATAVRDYLSHRQLTYTEETDAHGVAYARCRLCGGTGRWGSEVRHELRQTERGPILCPVGRLFPDVYAPLVAQIAATEHRSGDAPVISPGA